MVRRHASNANHVEQAIADYEELADVNPNMIMINIVADPREPITVNLVGTEYVVKPPKAALAMKLAVTAKSAEEDPSAMMAAVNQWISIAFGKVGAKAIQKRLEDMDDDLDFPHIMQLMEAMIERATGNPTSSS